MDRLLTVIAALSILLIGIVLFNIRRAHIRVEYSVSWLGAAAALLLLSQWPWGLTQLARFLGTGNPAIALLLVVGALFLIVLFRLSLVISDLRDANVALTQKLAILEYKLESLHEKRQTPGRE